MAMVIPPYYSISPGDLVISPIRGLGILYFLIFVPKLYKESRYVSNVTSSDIFMSLHCLWVCIAIFYWEGGLRALEAGGIYAVELLGFYAFGRYVAQNPKDLLLLFKIFVILVFVSALLAWTESLTGYNMVYESLGLPFHRPADPRFGLERASVYMQHPILYGLFISMMMGMAIYRYKKHMWKVVLLFFVATFPALSSAPLLSLLVQTSVAIWDQLLKSKAWRWKLAGILAFIFYLLIEIPSDRSFISILISVATFNPWSGYYRMLIWEYGIQEVINSPLIGIGFNDWVRPRWMVSNTVDNFWLLTMMRYGIPALLMILIPIIFSAKKLASRNYFELNFLRAGWLVSLVGIVIVGATVHFWANVFSMFGFFIGIGVTIANYRPSVVEGYKEKN